VNYMFIRCYSLISIPDLSIWNTSGIDMEYLFDNECINSLNDPLEFTKKNNS